MLGWHLPCLCDMVLQSKGCNFPLTLKTILFLLCLWQEWVRNPSAKFIKPTLNKATVDQILLPVKIPQVLSKTKLKRVDEWNKSYERFFTSGTLIAGKSQTTEPRGESDKTKLLPFESGRGESVRTVEENWGGRNPLPLCSVKTDERGPALAVLELGGWGRAWGMGPEHTLPKAL